MLAYAHIGDAAPTGSGGTNGTFTGFASTFLNASGQGVFLANASSGGEGIFRGNSQGSVIAFARVGDAAPAVGGGTNGTFTSFGNLPTLNSSGQAAFTGYMGGTNHGIFRGNSAGSVTACAGGPSRPRWQRHVLNTCLQR